MPGQWAFLADPKDYGWTELEGEGAAVWDGIKNARAQNYMRKCELGDLALIYHTAPDKAAVGIARVTGTARPDPNAAERVVIDVEPHMPLARSLSLAEMKADGVLSQMSFVRMPRVAVQPITDEQWQRVLSVSGTKL